MADRRHDDMSWDTRAAHRPMAWNMEWSIRAARQGPLLGARRPLASFSTCSLPESRVGSTVGCIGAFRSDVEIGRLCCREPLDALQALLADARNKRGFVWSHRSGKALRLATGKADMARDDRQTDRGDRNSTFSSRCYHRWEWDPGTKYAT